MKVSIKGTYADLVILAVELRNSADSIALLNRRAYDNMNVRLTEKATVLNATAKKLEEAVFEFPVNNDCAIRDGS